MADAKAFPLVRGRLMRVTKTDGCCAPDEGDNNSVVSDGFVSIAFAAQVTEAEEIVVVNANGKNCVRDVGTPTFDGYGLEITFCNVQPCLYSLMTGQPLALDAGGNVIGFKMNSKVDLGAQGFALEVWMGVPGVACEGTDGAHGYLLVPCSSGGVIGDFTVENGAVTFVVTGALTKDGNGWGTGPYPDHQLANPLDPNDHLYVAYSTETLPTVTDGCVALVPSGLSVDVSSDPSVTVNIPRGNGDCYDGTVTIDYGDGNVVPVPSDPTDTNIYATNGNYDVIVSAPGCNDVTFPITIAGA